MKFGAWLMLWSDFRTQSRRDVVGATPRRHDQPTEKCCYTVLGGCQRSPHRL